MFCDFIFDKFRTVFPIDENEHQFLHTLVATYGISCGEKKILLMIKLGHKLSKYMRIVSKFLLKHNIKPISTLFAISIAATGDCIYF